MAPVDPGTAIALVFGLFGRSSDDGDDFERIARVLDAEPNPGTIERRLQSLSDAIDTLVAQADLEYAGASRLPPDASPVEKAEALVRAVETDAVTVAPGVSTEESTTRSPVSAVASALARERRPGSPAASRLLEVTATPDDADRAALREALAVVVDTVERHHELERALSDADAGDHASLERLQQRLAREDGPVADDVAAMANRLATLSRERDRRRSEGEPAIDALERLTAAVLERAGDEVAAGTDSTPGRARALADAIERGDVTVRDAEREAAAAARAVERTATPESETARRLLGALAGDASTDLEAALLGAVTELDEAATGSSVTADVDRGDVDALVASVAEAVAAIDGPVADALADRIAALREMLDRAAAKNRVVPYAIRQEVRFYERTLVPALSERRPSASGGGADDPAELLDLVDDRRSAIEEYYVERRSDHNHSIPLHFLSLVDSLYEEARAARARGRTARATGLLDAANKLLDEVEALYERNEYSVLLRRLRG